MYEKKHFKIVYTIPTFFYMAYLFSLSDFFFVETIFLFFLPQTEQQVIFLRDKTGNYNSVLSGFPAFQIFTYGLLHKSHASMRKTNFVRNMCHSMFNLCFVAFMYGNSYNNPFL